jgi:hypothetical protein
VRGPSALVHACCIDRSMVYTGSISGYRAGSGKSVIFFRPILFANGCALSQPPRDGLQIRHVFL